MFIIAHTPRFCLLGGCKGRGATTNAPASLCGLQAFSCAFRYALALELGDRGEDVEDEPAGGCWVYPNIGT